jgi:hypothetical protein
MHLVICSVAKRSATKPIGPPSQRRDCGRVRGVGVGHLHFVIARIGRLTQRGNFVEKSRVVHLLSRASVLLEKVRSSLQLGEPRLDVFARRAENLVKPRLFSVGTQGLGGYN